MGNDGGSIPKRRELVKSAARAPTISELKATAHENLSHAWSHDPITSGSLDLENVVSDWLGRLYNYESVLKALLPSDPPEDGTSPPPSNGESPLFSFSSTGIKSLRDVVKLKFKRYALPGKKGEEVWACPVSLKELGPSTKAIYLVPCGHVFTEAAIKQIDEQVCPECSESFRSQDIIPILATEKSDIERLTARIDKLKLSGLTHSLKKDKGRGKKKRKVEEAKADSEEIRKDRETTEQNVKVPSPAMLNPGVSSRVSGINNAIAASLTAKVLAEQEERSKRRKLAAQK